MLNEQRSLAADAGAHDALRAARVGSADGFRQ
jgi:hypothetical protein